MTYYFETFSKHKVIKNVRENIKGEL